MSFSERTNTAPGPGNDKGAAIIHCMAWYSAISAIDGLLKEVEVKRGNFCAASQENICFVRKDVVDESGINTGGAGDVRHTYPVKTLTDEEISRCCSNFLATNLTSKLCTHAYPSFFARCT